VYVCTYNWLHFHRVAGRTKVSLDSRSIILLSIPWRRNRTESTPTYSAINKALEASIRHAVLASHSAGTIESSAVAFKAISR
jgi:hypothetical protein